MFRPAWRATRPASLRLERIEERGVGGAGSNPPVLRRTTLYQGVLSTLALAPVRNTLNSALYEFALVVLGSKIAVVQLESILCLLFSLSALSKEAFLPVFR